MTIRLQGILPDPFGNPCGKAVIRFTAEATEGGVLKGVDATHITLADGSYDFPLHEGRYLLEINYTDEFQESGSVVVDEFTPTDITLQALILYATPYTPPLVDDLPTHWETLFQNVIGSDEWDRQAEQQVRIEDKFVNEDKTIAKADESYLSKETLTTSTGSASAVNQTLAFEDNYGRSASYDKNEVSATDVSIKSGQEVYSDNAEVTAVQTTRLDASETSSETRKELTNQSVSTTSQDSVGDVTEALSKSLNNTEAKSTTTTSIGSDVITEKKYIDATTLVEALLEQNVVVENVEAFDRLKVTKDYSQRDIQVDTFNVGSTLSVDTKTDVVTVAGQLRLTNGDDYKGPVGDSAFYEYAYASQEEKDQNIWHIDSIDNPYPIPEGSVVWRKHRMVTIVDGVRTEGQWSEPYLLTGKDGEAGDTLYWDYKYKADNVLDDPDADYPAGWDATLLDGHLYRIERLVKDGVYQGSWSTPARIAGADGDNGELVYEEYMYSPQGVTKPDTEPSDWHYDFVTGDYYRSSRLVKYPAGTPLPIPEDLDPSLTTNWTNPTLITPRKGYEYVDGEQGTHGAGSYVLEWDDAYNSGNGYQNLVKTIEPVLTEAHVEFWYFQVVDRDSQSGDVLTIQQGNTSTPMQWLRGDTGWEDFVQVVDGNALFNGSVVAEKIKADTINGDHISATAKIIAGTGNNIGALDGIDSTYRIYAGHVTPASAPFRVDQSGKMFSTSGQIGGWSIDGNSIYAGTKDTSGYTAGGITLYGNGDSSSFHSKEFYIDTAGNAYFKGSLSAADGTFSGTIYANKISGDVVTARRYSASDTTSTSTSWTTFDRVRVSGAESKDRTLLISVMLSAYSKREGPSTGSHFCVAEARVTGTWGTITSKQVSSGGNNQSTTGSNSDTDRSIVQFIVPVASNATGYMDIQVRMVSYSGSEATARLSGSSSTHHIAQLFQAGTDLGD
ncbi:hypothetical protein NVP1238A_25 [Vibrio phage 1.238.A._10N.261.52.F10]|uniref:Coil containing protein n=1 Tax=Vibrio phage 1.238.A._10N.261.52.F10 TaxID=1881231 RepID=A0A2I7RUG6_9CAUD|nr:tail fiber protein [Vibrio phage 1.238.A._10N.261.52.F10]AUR97274.1 hypothetical protein NVP1238A_25 [Vibrio phage 1.238.A._10N.261.52.F10]AUR97368.1 hypothetical protein NVP1238B_26 [Vibrio phage 1.238.B._10N.261.52.F10]